MSRKRKPKLEVQFTRTDVTPDHVALYDYVYVDKKTGEVDHQWHPLVNLDNGDVWCDCEDFRFTRNPNARNAGVRPNIGTPRYQCKHIQESTRDCIDRGDIKLNLQEASHAQTEAHHRR